MRNSILEIKDLKKRFGEKEVLQGVSLCVPEKKVYGFRMRGKGAVWQYQN